MGCQSTSSERDRLEGARIADGKRRGDQRRELASDWGWGGRARDRRSWIKGSLTGSKQREIQSTSRSTVVSSAKIKRDVERHAGTDHDRLLEGHCLHLAPVVPERIRQRACVPKVEVVGLDVGVLGDRPRRKNARLVAGLEVTVLETENIRQSGRVKLIRYPSW